MAFGPLNTLGEPENSLGPDEFTPALGEWSGWPVRGGCCPIQVAVAFYDADGDPTGDVGLAVTYRVVWLVGGDRAWRTADGAVKFKWAEYTLAALVYSYTEMEEEVVPVDGDTVIRTMEHAVTPGGSWGVVGPVPDLEWTEEPGVTLEISADGVSWAGSGLYAAPMEFNPTNLRECYAQRGDGVTIASQRWLRVTFGNYVKASFPTFSPSATFPRTIRYRYREVGDDGAASVDELRTVVQGVSDPTPVVTVEAPTGAVQRVYLSRFESVTTYRLLFPLMLSLNECLEV